MPLFSSKELSTIRILEKGAVSEEAKDKQYDIFLSHSYDDNQYVEPIKQVFEDLGYSVYVDWITDKQLDRTCVTSESADKLRERMRKSKSLFYLTSEHASTSKWMPWELGFFDGLKQRVAILPITMSLVPVSEYRGQEYLGLYPYVYHEDKLVDLKVRLKNPARVISFKDWILHGDDMIAKMTADILKRLYP